MILISLQRFFCFSFFFFLFHEDDQSSSPAPDVFPIYLFVIYLCIFIHLPPRRRRRRRRCHTHSLRLEKTLRLGRNCLLRSRYIGCEAPSFLPGVLRRHSQFNTSKVIDTFEAHRRWRHQLEIDHACRHFSFPWCTPYVNVKLSGACAELKITYQLYGLSIRNPIRKVRIAEPLYWVGDLIGRCVLVPWQR